MFRIMSYTFIFVAKRQMTMEVGLSLRFFSKEVEFSTVNFILSISNFTEAYHEIVSEEPFHTEILIFLRFSVFLVTAWLRNVTKNDNRNLV